MKTRLQVKQGPRSFLTQKLLVKYDDAALDVLVDSACSYPNHRTAYFTTLKSRIRHMPLRGISVSNVLRIICDDILGARKLARAEQNLLGLPSLATLQSRVHSAAEKGWFRQHFRSYIKIYHPECPFDAVAINRYDCNPNCRLVVVSSQTIAVEAQRDIGTGEEITIFYSKDYSGDGNCDCLCVTCKRKPFWPVTTFRLMENLERRV